MAASEKVYAIKLTENDVPGAKFKSAVIEEHSVIELKRWLECRGLATTGNKTSLIERCKMCIDAKEDKNIIISVDGGKWFQKKFASLIQPSRETCIKVPVLPTTGWKTFPSSPIPEPFCYGHIYEHIISTAKVYNSNESSEGISDFATEKPMKKGRQYFLSGHVKDISDTKTVDCFFVKCKVMASYELKKSYFVSITLCNKDGKVLDASCECKASAMSRCNHVAALLFALEDYVLQFGHNPVSCTSELCTWNVGRKTKRQPQPCHESFSKTKKLKLDRIIKHDPRPEEFVEDSRQFMNNFVATLPHAGVTMFEQVMEISYPDYTVDRETLKKLSHEAIHQLNSFSSDQPTELENTIDQAQSHEWHQARCLRVTASNAKSVSIAKSGRQQYSLLKKMLWNVNNSLSDLKAVQYGKDMENSAFLQYEREIISPGEHLSKSGFWVNPSMPELGCSPDGLIRNIDNKVKGVVEIKCPYVLEQFSPTDFENIPKKKMQNLCYEIVDGKIKLKRNHAYYCQVQMQIAVCEVQFCDFVVWSPKGMSVERINKDTDFWMDLKSKLIKFHHNVLIPEYFEMRVPRRLMPVDLEK